MSVLELKKYHAAAITIQRYFRGFVKRRAFRFREFLTAITVATTAMNDDESKVSASAIPWYVEAVLGLLDFMPAALILIFCFVPSVSASIFRAWSCQAPSRTPAADCVVQPCSSVLATCCS